MSIALLYNRRQTTELVRDWTAHRLFDALRAEQFNATLSSADIDELTVLTHDWVRRALGEMPLRDALLIDPQRGGRVYHLLCVAFALDCCKLPADLAQRLPANSAAETPVHAFPADIRDALCAQCPALDSLLAANNNDDIALAAFSEDAPAARLPADLDALLPPSPAPLPNEVDFEPPAGWRSALAMGLALAGVALVGLPLMFGTIPSQTAGLPLALITLALLIGIRAGVAGYAGAFCFWLTANLPGFRYGSLLSLWPAIPLMLAGGALLRADRRVRALVRWIRQRFA